MEPVRGHVEVLRLANRTKGNAGQGLAWAEPVRDECPKKLLASFNNHEEACNMLCGTGLVRTQDLGYQSGAL
jgi:hypothetical protein